MKGILRILAMLLSVIAIVFTISSCEPALPTDSSSVTSVEILGDEKIYLEIGDILTLVIDELEDSATDEIKWNSSGDAVTVSSRGVIKAVREGMSIVTARCGGLSDSVIVYVSEARSAECTEHTDENGDGACDSCGAAVENNTEPTPTPTPEPEPTPTPTPTPTPEPEPTPTPTPTPDTEPEITSDPYVNVTKEQFYANYKPASCYMDAYYRTQHGFMSGSLDVPDQAPVLSAYRPMQNGLYVRNTAELYSDDGNTYTVIDAYGNPVMKIYRGGAYITLEEVAAYVYAFGDIPANYTSKKSGSSTLFATWGEYLRLNHSYFSGDTSSYPYEPVLPNISGCGGDLQYYEMDIGTTGTDCDPGYKAAIYNTGSKITRGAARIVYGKYDINGNGVFDEGEHYLFYTYNHYNDFREYLNYWGGWGEMFGNITGGGSISSTTNYNPTPYVKVSRADLTALGAVSFDEYYYDNKKILDIVIILPKYANM